MCLKIPLQLAALIKYAGAMGWLKCLTSRLTILNTNSLNMSWQSIYSSAEGALSFVSSFSGIVSVVW